MPWSASWHDTSETIFILEPIQPWLWEEYVAAVRQAQSMIKGKPYKVDNIYKLPDDFKLPPGNALYYARAVFVDDPPNSRMIVVANANFLVQSLVGALTSIVGGAKRF